MSEWQTIETAPKNGAAIILCAKGPDCGFAIASWDETWGSDGWWMCDDGKCAIELPLRGPEPTHWMPLPQPPVA